MKRPAGRRAGKVARAGLPKAKRSRLLQPKPVPVRPLSAEAERDARTLHLDAGIAPHAGKWSAAEKRARRAARAAAAPAEEEEEEAEAEEAAPERPSAGRSQHGSHFVTGVESGKVNDEWQTTADAWAELAPLLAHWKKRRVWMPFYYDGQCAVHLRELGFKVRHQPGRRRRLLFSLRRRRARRRRLAAFGLPLPLSPRVFFPFQLRFPASHSRRSRWCTRRDRTSSRGRATRASCPPRWTSSSTTRRTRRRRRRRLCCARWWTPRGPSACSCPPPCSSPSSSATACRKGCSWCCPGG